MLNGSVLLKIFSVAESASLAGSVLGKVKLFKSDTVL